MDCLGEPVGRPGALASHYPELSLRTERAHREGTSRCRTLRYRLARGEPGSAVAARRRVIARLGVGAGHRGERLTLKPEDLALRITYFATGPVTETSAPYRDFAVPFA